MNQGTIGKIIDVIRKKRNVHNNYTKKIYREAAAARKSKLYGQWKRKVYARDNYTCRKCGRKNIKLNAHHIKGFFRNKSLRFNVNNGLALCQQCHYKFHKKFGKSNFPDIRLVWELRDVKKPRIDD